MSSASHAQIYVDLRHAELLKTFAAERLAQSARENLVSSVADRPSITRRMFVFVNDTVSRIGGEIAAAGRRPQLDRAHHGVEVPSLGSQVGERVVGEPDLEVEVGEAVGGPATEGARVEDAEHRRIRLDGGFEPFEDRSQ